MRPTRVMTAIAVPSLMTCAFALAACAPNPDADPEIGADDVYTEARALIVPAGTSLWTAATNRTIPMCWHELLQFPDKNAEAVARDFVRRTIEDSWISLLDLKITWEECPTSGTAKHIRIKLRVGDSNYNGTTLKTGMDALSVAAERAIQPPNDPPGLLMGFPSGWTETGFRQLIQHEFGHILGFVDDLACSDPTSIMTYSYCPTTLGVPTPADIAAARGVYGYGRSGSNDFNGDGRGDILWHNSTTHLSEIWFMSGTSRFGRATVLDEYGNPARIGPPWRIVGSADFDGDRSTDILWHNDTTNETKAWLMNGSRLKTSPTVVDENGRPIFVGLPWRIVGTGDFDYDGRQDILWHNDSSNELQIWTMAATQIVRRLTVTDELGRNIFVGKPWEIVGTGDFNGDGRPDILWHNDSSNAMQVWTMNRNRITDRPNVRDQAGNVIFVGRPWRIAGTNDFNQDGWADILWNNESTGEIQVWSMRGASIARPTAVDADLDGGGALVGPPWSIMRH
jgi:hypothetical protein